MALPIPAMIASGSWKRSLPKLTLPNGWTPTSLAAGSCRRSGWIRPALDAPVPTLATTVRGLSGSATCTRPASSAYPR